MDTIIDWEGHIAIDCGWATDWNKPEKYRLVYIGRAKATDYPQLIGRDVQWNGNTGIVYDPNYRRYLLHSDNEEEWTKEVVETKPVPKPRRKKNQRYDYEWRSGRWQPKF